MGKAQGEHRRIVKDDVEPLWERLQETEALINKARKAGEEIPYGLGARARCLRYLITAIKDGNYHIWHKYLRRGVEPNPIHDKISIDKQ